VTIRSTDILADLRELADQLDLELPEAGLTEAASLENDLGMDSLNLMDFLVFLEKKYQVQISDDRLGDVETIADIVHVLNEISAGAAPGAADTLAEQR
jgi:acyl carrier protein